MKVFRTNLFVMLTAAALTLPGCAVPQQKPPMTPLEIQSIQTRNYDAPKKTVFASVMSVFQDLGYTIKGANLDTGFINAESATQNATSGVARETDRGMDGGGIVVGILGDILLGDDLGGRGPTQHVEQTVATAFIEEIKKRTRVRLNFVTTRQSSSAYGQNSRNDTPILDVQIYTNAFERIENAIFIRSGE